MDAADLVAYLRASPTPWHAVREARRRLAGAGYRELREGEAWALTPSDRVFVVRGGSTLAAFELGEDPLEDAGFRLVGAHTDSPNLRLKPAGVAQKSGQHQALVEPYGGLLQHSWLDRDLGIAGRVLLRSGVPGGLESVLVEDARGLARVPSLAIHLDRQVNTDGLKLNPQLHLAPVLGLESGGALDSGALLVELCGRAGRTVAPGDVLGFDLAFFDAAPPAVAGLRDEYVASGRLDNLASCHAALSALLSVGRGARASRGIVLYDHEECGSQSAQGAQSQFLRDVIARVVAARTGGSADAVARTVHHSFFVSADMAHAVHPGYADKHEPAHQPQLGAGPVLKVNVNQRYATDGEGMARFALACEKADVKPQRFVTRSDLPCGTTIGPITAALLGMRVVDIGSPMLSMHSSREMAAAADVPKMISVMRAFFE